MAIEGAVTPPASVQASPNARALWFLGEFGGPFGVVDANDVRVRHQVYGDAGSPEEGDTLITYDRVENGVRVLGADIKVEVAADGTIVTAIGQSPADLAGVDITPTVSVEQARSTASEPYPGANVVSAELLLLNEGMLSGFEGPTRLTWRVALSTSEQSPVRFVDAHGGNLLPFQTTLHEEDRNRVTSSFELRCTGDEFVVQLTEEGPVEGITPTADAARAHEHVRATYDYFWERHERDSFDGSGGELFTFTELRGMDDSGECMPLANAFWDRETNSMVFGEGLAVLDIVAHEFTHGLIHATAGLVYAGQSGALNESFSDTFASLIDSDSPWTIGDGSPQGALRDMSSPGSFGQPSHMNQFFSINEASVTPCQTDSDCGGGCALDGGACAEPCTDFQCVSADGMSAAECQGVPGACNDFGGVHINSGIPNHAMYLATAGGTAPDGTEIVGMGKDKAEKICFRALTWYLTSGATFEHARLALRLAAQKFAEDERHDVSFRDCGTVLTAYGAVGIGAVDTDLDCWDDTMDNCTTVYNPEQDDVECPSCENFTGCVDCAAAQGCVWCRDPTGNPMGDTCVAQNSASCSTPVTDPQMCTVQCSSRAEACGGSGADFDTQCCDGLVCVVGSCVEPGGREQTPCATTEDCALGLVCRPQGMSDGQTLCCARDQDPCATKADCCGFQECVAGICEGRAPGDACINGDCIGSSFCSDGVCT